MGAARREDGSEGVASSRGPGSAGGRTAPPRLDRAGAARRRWSDRSSPAVTSSTAPTGADPLALNRAEREDGVAHPGQRKRLYFPRGQWGRRPPACPVVTT